MKTVVTRPTHRLFQLWTPTIPKTCPSNRCAYWVLCRLHASAPVRCRESCCGLVYEIKISRLFRTTVGGHIYQLLGKPYQTPFIGLFFAPNCYLTLISRLRWYLSQPVRFTRRSRHDNINELREQQGSLYPIGYLGDDIEVQFMHYKSEAEAAEKWARRVERVCRDDDRLFFKFCDRDGCTQDQLAAFDSAPIAHKVCFVSRPSPQLRHAVLIPSEHDSQVPDGLSLSRISPRYFDTAGWIMGSNGRPRWWQPVRCI
jgi:uncharacterized protein (DUF1919 family)